MDTVGQSSFTEQEYATKTLFTVWSELDSLGGIRHWAVISPYWTVMVNILRNWTVMANIGQYWAQWTVIVNIGGY